MNKEKGLVVVRLFFSPDLVSALFSCLWDCRELIIVRMENATKSNVNGVFVEW